MIDENVTVIGHTHTKESYSLNKHVRLIKVNNNVSNKHIEHVEHRKMQCMLHYTFVIVNRVY